MLTVATCLWAKNGYTNPLSGSYTEEWAERLYRSFKRHLTTPFRFVCFVDRKRKFREPIEQEMLSSSTPDYGSFTEPYRLDEPMILVGLDTIIVGNIDHFADWCLTGDKIALLRDRKSYRLKHQGYPDQSINGVAFVPKGWKRVYDEWRGENDMAHLRKYPWEPIDDRYGMHQVASYKMDIRPNDNKLFDETRIVYFHGVPKANELTHLDWVKENWS